MRLLLAFDGKAKMTVLRRDLMPCFIEKWGFRRNHLYFYFWIQKTVNGLRIWDQETIDWGRYKTEQPQN